MRALALACLVSGCAAPRAELAWRVCPRLQTPDGRDIDDGGVDVWAEARARGARSIRLGHFPGACRRIVGPLPSLECSEPHVDIRFVMRWTRPRPTRLALEYLEFAIPYEDGVPAPKDPSVRREVASIALTPEAPVVEARASACQR